MEVFGDCNSLRLTTISELESIYEMEFAPYEFVPTGLVKMLCYLTTKINREIAVYLNRKGKVVTVCVGDSQTVSLPIFEGRRDKNRLSGIRCIHTHPRESGELSSVDLNSLYTIKFDAMIAVGVNDEESNGIYAAILRQENGEYSQHDIYGPLECSHEENDYLTKLVLEHDKDYSENIFEISGDAEKAILVGLDCDIGKKGDEHGSIETLMAELEELANTAGAEVLAKIIQKKNSKDSATYIGKGKIDELALVVQSLNANLVIFDDELSGAQIRNIENIVGVKVIDRTSLILDIFAKRARSKEGKLQVELAQLKYRMPRLMGLGLVLSRLGGGIGTRGPGEKKLESDRRHIRRRVQYLESEIKMISKKRDVLRQGRDGKNMPIATIVGYTNAGKSTLLNALTNSCVLVEDKVFATLDPTTRGIKLTDGRDALLVDTVGFIRKLPHDLVESFKSTLEEVLYADLLIHVVDASSKEFEGEIKVVNELLESIGAKDKQMLLVYNKIDKTVVDSNFREYVLPDFAKKSVQISALSRNGLDQLLEAITGMLKSDERKIHVFAPYSVGWVYPYICDNGSIIETSYDEDGIRIKAIIKGDKYKKIEEFCLNN